MPFFIVITSFTAVVVGVYWGYLTEHVEGKESDEEQQQAQGDISAQVGWHLGCKSFIIWCDDYDEHPCVIIFTPMFI